MYLKQCLVTSNVEYFKGEVGDIIKSHKTIKQYAYILHDKDLGQSPHWTIYLNFGNSGVDTKQVGEWFGLQESQVERIKGRKTDALQYLTHSNDTQKHKYQYPVSEITANFDFETEITNSKILGDFDNFSYAEQLDYVNTLPSSERAVAFTKLERLWKCHCQWLTLKANRRIEVVFVTGKGGTGKTYYAKKLMEQMNYDYCVSSSSNDPWQDYMGQKGMILDDLRDTAFSFEDLLKALDNDTSSSIKRRFSNVVFAGFVIVITSSVPLIHWYKRPDKSGNRIPYDELAQLYRRITTYVELKNDEIIVYNDGVDDYGHPSGLGQVFKNNLLRRIKNEKPKTDFCALFGAICETATTDIFDIQQLPISEAEKYREKPRRKPQKYDLSSGKTE